VNCVTEILGIFHLLHLQGIAKLLRLEDGNSRIAETSANILHIYLYPEKYFQLSFSGHVQSTLNETLKEYLRTSCNRPKSTRLIHKLLQLSIILTIWKLK